MDFIKEVDRRINKTGSAQTRLFSVNDGESLMVKFYIAQTGTSGLSTEWIESRFQARKFDESVDAEAYQRELLGG